MTKDIDLAHKADCLDESHYGSLWAEKLKRFAALVRADAAADERQFIINFLESMHERCLGTHNYYLHAANCIRNLPAIKST